MKADRVTAMVLVQDMDRAMRFYRDTLGFTITFEEEDWALFAENVGLMVSPEPLPQDNFNLNAVMITLNVADVPSGVYFLRVTAGGVEEVKRVCIAH